MRRLALYVEAGADMVFPTLVGAAELAAVRKRIAKPAMVVDMSGSTLAEHRDAEIVLYYAFSLLVQYEALNAAIAQFKRDGRAPTGTPALEALLGYADFASRAKRYSG